MQPRKYDWSKLQDLGDWLIVEGLPPVKVRTTVAAYVKRHLPYGTVVVTRETPRGTFVAIAHVPDKQEAHRLEVKRQVEEPDLTSDDPDDEIRQYLDD